ncbi:hypothetical protein CA13_64550 [Planctomycetes bacterium CA13]|uniref:Uncharacterized protein n=1 Tax=Novipirellula herctigrandis TaxID=2527986 RepID=A0A5C5ZEK5_9BACT|nr:hypothetical protein CA13_64550 [Planctomycetes bacterium CA13]
MKSRSIVYLSASCFSLVLGIVIGTSVRAQEEFADNAPLPPSMPSVSASSLRAEALRALQEGDSARAVLAADAIVRQHGDEPRSIRLAADIYLRSGKVTWAVRMFDRYLKAEPEQRPELWQRGIALCFAGDYEQAAEQFEAHRNVNPNDVENAAWHFLCIAKLKSFDDAKKNVLPAPGDRRVPMAEILAMFSSDDIASVDAKVTSLAAGSDERKEAAFYGDLYQGIYADARGDSILAETLVTRASQHAPHNYMGDIARVYARRLALNATR